RPSPSLVDSLKPICAGLEPSSRMDSNSQIEISESASQVPDFIRNSSSQRSISPVQSVWSKTSGGRSIREVSFGELESKPVRHGSRGADSEGFSASYKEINDDDARLIYINDPDRTDEKFEFAGNSIRTGKYSILTFLPRNLFEQFHRVAYIYFLVIAILNQLPQLAVFGRGASIMPLAFVLLVTAIKDGYEDYRRHRSDKIENSRLAWALLNEQFQQIRWKDIRVGQIIKVSANETLPCDMVLLSTSDTTGVAYVQTTNLDGESNLKTRYAKQETQTKNVENEKISGLIKCEKPNRNIYGFQANMDIDGKRISLGPSNIILRGCELKNTEWAVGVVVYAGRETKAMLNNSGAPSKRSHLETRMNREIIFLSIFLVALCTIVSACHGVWLRRHKDELDLMQFYRKKDYSGNEVEDYNYYGWGLEIFFVFLMSVIVFQIMIPISLYISMELVRVGQAFFMIQDNRMWWAGLRPKERLRLTPSFLIYQKENTQEGKHVCDFFIALAACNTIVPITVETPDAAVNLVDYQGESPDEQALVYAAAAYGFMLIERTSGHIVIDIHGERQRFNVLGLHEFDSDRKRMSVILGCPDKTVKVFVKGADTSMFSVINRSLHLNMLKVIETHLHTYSSKGLRTLVIGMRELSPSEFEQWQSSYELASTALMGRAALLRKVAGNIENHLTILGASGIEDKLQQGVPEAIESLRTAGIKVWVLTGDKQETAISIGYSSKLLTSKMTQIVINNNSKDSCRKSLQDALLMWKKLTTDSSATPGGSRTGLNEVALIIDGTSLVYILDTDLEEQLFELASKCDVVLCCRVAPLQKAGIVALIKNRTDDMTLAIGDGANDVSMIQMADVGIGISGQEGRQAVMASDFAMGQFRFLVPLLLVHGHWNYQRMSYMILYNFYRNAVFVLVLFWYVLFTSFTLTTAITDWSSVLFSVIYTSFPTIVVGILDKDLSRTSLIEHPQLYGAGQRQKVTTENCSGAFFHIAKTALFWLCLLCIMIGALLPRFLIKVFMQYYKPTDIQIAREAEKFNTSRASQAKLCLTLVDLPSVSTFLMGAACPNCSMKSYKLSDLTSTEVESLKARPRIDFSSIFNVVQPIVDDIRNRGDAAVKDYTMRFDKVELDIVVENVNDLPDPVLDPAVQKAFDVAYDNIFAFHFEQKPVEKIVENMEGVRCKRVARCISSVGLYVPGGTAVLPSTALMLSVPAQIAGCKTIVLATPPAEDGSICKEVLYCAKKAGVTHILKAGGAQAISAMAWGTESCPKNSEAMISIDMPAGPSEVLVIADKHANPVHIAADLLSQAEHGPDSQVVLVVAGEGVNITAIEDEISKQCNSLPRGNFASKALSHSFTVYARDMLEAISFSNLYAPEHLIINVKDAEKWEPFIENAGSVFLGQWTPESVGDYASGTNHVLPTYGYARMYGGVSLDSFLKYITVQSLTEEGLRNLGPYVATMAEVEGLDAHKRAVTLRLQDIEARQVSNLR
ncbi:UNVERIFIED_CONTAM: Phospholipid-transporting ATPase 1, partial [Sesamum calycinum]